MCLQKVAKSLQDHEKDRFDREWRRRREEETLGREQQEREQRRLESEEIDEQTTREMRDAVSFSCLCKTHFDKSLSTLFCNRE